MPFFPRKGRQSDTSSTMRDTAVFYISRLLLLSCILPCVVAFNVDTENPIVFRGPKNTYFGYSVAILENTQGTWLLVGAPRANDSSLPGIHQPGAVFQCNWRYPSSCQLVFVDDVGNAKQVIQKGKNFTVHHGKDNQWLGTSVDVNVHGDSQVMVCAPRWTEMKYDGKDIRPMNGLCYETNRDLHFDEKSAWPIFDNKNKQVHPTGYFSYGMSSLGTSATYSRNGKFSVLGAPGVNDWAGGFAYMDGAVGSRPRIMELSQNESNSYFGMSVTTAKLTAEGVYTIIGGPRAGGSGKVYVYDSDFQFLFAKEGSQTGSSFGSSVCSVDLNGDSLDDLVVGAPFYSEVMDEGRVYVYFNKEFFNLELMQPLLAGSNVPGARFGTAVANVGDLNLDYYEDLAVGAPYEELAGIVYIYNGAKHGLHTEPSQRIVGKSLSKDLKAFGWSFSRPWDIDSNRYKDFAVGSYASDKVILLRTRPVFDLKASLELSSTVINFNDQPNCVYDKQPWHCLEASMCFRYNGQNLPPSAELNISLRLDTLERFRGERARLFILDGRGTEVESINESFAVRLDRNSCLKNSTLFIKKSTDIITPVQIELEYDIASNSHGITSMNIIEPIRNKYNPKAILKMVTFALDCGNHHICNPNLNIKTTPIFHNGLDHLLIDNSPYFDLEIVVSNAGETSYLTVVTIEYPSSLHFSTVYVAKTLVRINCLPDLYQPNITVARLGCDILTPVKSKDKVVLTARFYAYNVSYNVNKLQVKTKVHSEAQTKTTSDVEKEYTVNIPVKVKTDITFVGFSIPGQLALPKDLSTVQNEWSQLSHLYVLRNLGPSPMPHGQLIVSVPIEEWIKLTNVQTETRGTSNAFSHVPVECSLSSNQNQTQINQTDHLKYKSKTTEHFANFTNCDPTMCFNVTCYVGLVYNYVTVYLNITFHVKTNVLQMLQVSQLNMMTSGMFKEPDYVSYDSFSPGINIVATTYIMYKNTPGHGVTWWLLIISISSGLLLLYILIIALWKCGFFRRRKQEKMQLLIKSFDNEREVLHSDFFSADSGDVMILHSSHSSHSPNHNSALFFYPHLEPDFQVSHNLPRHNFFQNHTMNRREIIHDVSPIQSFRTLQHSGRSTRNTNYPSNSPRRNHPSNGVNAWSNLRNGSSQPNIWMASSREPTPQPTFNNDMYLEPIESRA